MRIPASSLFQDHLSQFFAFFYRVYGCHLGSLHLLLLVKPFLLALLVPLLAVEHPKRNDTDVTLHSLIGWVSNECAFFVICTYHERLISCVGIQDIFTCIFVPPLSLVSAYKTSSPILLCLLSLSLSLSLSLPFGPPFFFCLLYLLCLLS